MSGIFAKRVLTALARKLSYANVRRENYHGKYQLKLVGKNGKSAPLMLRVSKGNDWYIDMFLFTSTKWTSILNALVGKTIVYDKGADIEWKTITSVEELVIDLELKGFLRRT